MEKNAIKVTGHLFIDMEYYDLVKVESKKKHYLMIKDLCREYTICKIKYSGPRLESTPMNYGIKYNFTNPADSSKKLTAGGWVKYHLYAETNRLYLKVDGIYVTEPDPEDATVAILSVVKSIKQFTEVMGSGARYDGSIYPSSFGRISVKNSHFLIHFNLNNVVLK